METQIMTRKEVFNKLNSRAVIILQGLPGAGKSTMVDLIEQHLNSPDPNALAVCSADHFFCSDDGEYVFNKHLLGHAHHVCKQEFEMYAARKGNKRPIFLVVDNTNLTNKDTAWYVAKAKEYQWDVIFVTLEVDPDTSLARNIHSVPKETISEMAKKLASFKLPENCLHYTIKEN
jgi:predicted kinase